MLECLRHFAAGRPKPRHALALCMKATYGRRQPNSPEVGGLARLVSKLSIEGKSSVGAGLMLAPLVPHTSI
jgi:hypothetical protein